MVLQRLLANTTMEIVDEIEVVDAAMCFTLLARCFCWLSGVSAVVHGKEILPHGYSKCSE